ncbi:MAG: glycosyltransferase family protein [Desulfobacteraceae bacterium]|nr:glycosyltransferase family protein [Desulfobacteraceae bacterium]
MDKRRKIGAVVQARVSSTRLPGKVMKELPYGSGITVLAQVIRRLRRCQKLNDIIVATTTGEEDDVLVNIAQKEGGKYFRGSGEDVLSRYYFASKQNSLETIVRITSDCPCIDPEVVDLVIEKHITAKADFTSNALVRTFPHGLDTEVLNFDTLEKAHLQAKQGFEREHVCPYIYKSNPQMFKISTVEAPQRLRAPDIRITLDTEQDYALLCAVFDYLYPGNEFFCTEDIIKLFNDKLWLKSINKKVIQKKMFDSLEDELAEAVHLLDLQELKRAKEILMRHLK